MTMNQHAPAGNTNEDLEEAVKSARLAIDLAFQVINGRHPHGFGSTLIEQLAMVAPYAQMIELRLWELRQQRQR